MNMYSVGVPDRRGDVGPISAPRPISVINGFARVYVFAGNVGPSQERACSRRTSMCRACVTKL